MRSSRFQWGPRVVVGIGLLAASSATSRGAALKDLGLPEFTGTLTSNHALRQQQLLCDPEYADSGSTSVEYDPNISTLQEVDAQAGYQVTKVVIEEFSSNTSTSTFLNKHDFSSSPVQQFQVPYTEFSATPEGGYVQVFWKFKLGATPVTGPDNTFALLFQYDPTVDTVDAKYDIYADPGNNPDPDPEFGTHGRSDTPDAYTEDDPSSEASTRYTEDPNDPNYIKPGTTFGGETDTYGGIEGEVLDAPLPEPASLGLLGAGTLGLLGRRRRVPFLDHGTRR